MGPWLLLPEGSEAQALLPSLKMPLQPSQRLFPLSVQSPDTVKKPLPGALSMKILLFAPPPNWRPTSWFPVATRALGCLCHHLTFPSCHQSSRKESSQGWPLVAQPQGEIVPGSSSGTFVYIFSQNHLSKTCKALEHSPRPTGISQPCSLGKAFWAAHHHRLIYFWNSQGSEAEDCLCSWDIMLSGRPDSRMGVGRIFLFLWAWVTL